MGLLKVFSTVSIMLGRRFYTMHVLKQKNMGKATGFEMFAKTFYLLGGKKKLLHLT